MLTFETRDPDAAGERVADFFGDAATVEGYDKCPSFALRLQVTKLGALSLGRAEVANWRLIRATNASAIIAVTLSGDLRYQRGRPVPGALALKGASASRPFEIYTASVSKGVGVALTVPVEGLVARVERLTDKAYGDDLIATMTDEIDTGTPIARALVRSMNFTLAELASLATGGLQAIVWSGYEDVLSNLASACLFPQLFSESARGLVDCGPLTVRRAREYLREHADQPVDLSLLAQRLGVSMRTLQENFRRYYGASPRQYLLACRLERARQRLLAAGPGETVTRIAVESGFGDMGHFSANYRANFGELPVETLRTARESAGGSAHPSG